MQINCDHVVENSNGRLIKLSVAQPISVVRLVAIVMIYKYLGWPKTNLPFRRYGVRLRSHGILVLLIRTDIHSNIRNVLNQAWK